MTFSKKRIWFPILAFRRTIFLWLDSVSPTLKCVMTKICSRISDIICMETTERTQVLVVNASDKALFSHPGAILVDDRAEYRRETNETLSRSKQITTSEMSHLELWFCLKVFVMETNAITQNLYIKWNAEAMIGRPVAASSSTLGRPQCRAQRQAMSCDALI